MSDVLRSTTFQLEFKGQDGITGIRQFTRAVTDADKVVDELSNTLGENVSVTYKTVQSTQELTAEARALVAQMERSAAKTKELTSLYEHQTNIIGRTRAETEALNAVHKLGANATEEQKKKVAEVAYSYGLAAQKAQETSESFRGLRGVSQQLGWQLQDVAVQAQMGTSAFVIFSQQGSQLAAAFGPTGALVGAVIAVAGAIGGALVNSMGEAGEEIDKLIGKVDKLSKATKELAAIELRKKIADDQRRLVEIDSISRLGFLQDKQKSGAELTERELKQLLELTSKRDQLSDAIVTQEGYLDTLTRSEIENIEKSKQTLEATNKLLTSYGVKIDLLGKNDRQQALYNARLELGTNATQDQIKAVENAVNTYYNEHDAIKAREKAIKDAEKAEKQAANTSKQERMQRERAFTAETLSLIKQTETIDQEYSRRKKIIDAYVKDVGTSDRTDQTYAALEQWRTQKLTEETDKQIKEFQRRETARQQIEKGQSTRLSGVGGNLDNEKAKYEANLRLLTNQDSQVERELTRHLAALKTQRDNGKLTSDMYDMNVQKANQDALTEQARINALKEGEEDRHTKAMADFQLQIYAAQLQSIASAATIMSSITDLMSTGIEDVKAKTAEMNAFQKTMFLISQSIAAASALINGISLGSKLAEMFPLAAPAMITFGTTLGAAQAGAIMGTTFAGTFDNGGVIPAGQSGIVSEYGDELVNGVMVKGPARVTSREETAKMMNGGGSSVSILIENRIDGASYREERIDENTVKIIAEKVFNQNIDSGVSGVLGNRNSKSTKQLKNNFSVKGKY